LGKNENICTRKSVRSTGKKNKKDKLKVVKKEGMTNYYKGSLRIFKMNHDQKKSRSEISERDFNSCIKD
jgi:hypothetical protein